MIKKKIDKFWNNTGLFRRYIKKYKKYYIHGAIFLLVVDLFSLIHPLILKKSIDLIEKGSGFRDLYLYAILYFLVAIIMSVGRYYWRIYLTNAALNSVTDIRYNFFRHLTRLTGKFFNKTSSGDLMSLATNDMQSIRMMLGPGLLVLTDAIFFLVLVPPLLIYLSPRLAFYSFLTLPFIPFIISKMSTLVNKTWKDVQDEFANVSTIVHENVSGIRINKSFNNADFEIEKLQKGSQKYLKKLIRFSFIHAIFHPSIEFFFQIGVIIFLVLGGLFITKGEVSLGTYVAFYYYIDYLTWPMVAIGWSTSMYNQAVASKNRIEKVTKLEPEIKDVSVESFLDVETRKGNLPAIEFKNFSYKFEEDTNFVLKNINLKIERGITLGILGEVGSGKSTLVNFIPRLFEVPDNSLFIEGVDIKQYPLPVLRKKIAFVPQEVFLFSDSIKNNISFSNEALDKEKILKLSMAVKIHDEIVSFSNGYDTQLGEKGVNISGGQKQRLAIARAIASNSSILILDDSFSSIDTEVEEEILRNLKDIIKSKTTIIVGHRISTLKYADRIISLKEGNIIEDGTPGELISQKGHYYKLFQYQNENTK